MVGQKEKHMSAEKRLEKQKQEVKDSHHINNLFSFLIVLFA